MFAVALLTGGCSCTCFGGMSIVPQALGQRAQRNFCLCAPIVSRQPIKLCYACEGEKLRPRAPMPEHRLQRKSIRTNGPPVAGSIDGNGSRRFGNSPGSGPGYLQGISGNRPGQRRRHAGVSSVAVVVSDNRLTAGLQKCYINCPDRVERDQPVTFIRHSLEDPARDSNL